MYFHDFFYLNCHCYVRNGHKSLVYNIIVNYLQKNIKYRKIITFIYTYEFMTYCNYNSKITQDYQHTLFDIHMYVNQHVAKKNCFFAQQYLSIKSFPQTVFDDRKMSYLSKGIYHQKSVMMDNMFARERGVWGLF